MIEIFQVETAALIEEARKLFREYEAWLAVDLCFQSFEEELADLPGKYAAPDGGLLLASVEEKIAGCVAFRKIADDVCEMKRLFVREVFRGHKLGAKLIETLIEKAREAGYRSVRLDTLSHKMPAAIRLYKAYGFNEIAPYYKTPISETLFMSLDLTNPKSEI